MTDAPHTDTLGTPLNIITDLSQEHFDLPDDFAQTKPAVITQCGLLPAGTTEGRASFAMVITTEDGKTHIVETTWRLMQTAIRSLAAGIIGQREAVKPEGNPLQVTVDDPYVDPAYLAWAEGVQEYLVPMMAESVVATALVSGTASGDVKTAVELGFALLMDKPLIIGVLKGTDPPEKLAKIADAIFEVDPTDPEATREDLKSAIELLRATGLIVIEETGE